MSFLSGILDFGKSALGFFKSNTLASSLVKTALLGLAVNKLSQSALKDNNSGTQNIDKGVRLQYKPNAEAKIPVLYGDAYFGGNITDAAMTNANKTMWYCLVLSETTGSKYSSGSATSYTFQDVYWNQQRIVFQADGVTADYTVDTNGTIDRSVSGLVKVYLYAGGSSNGQAPSGHTATIPNADTLMPNWGSTTHPMTDLVFALVRVDYNREKNITGIADMLFQVESDMKKPGDVLYDYLTSTVYGAGIPTSEIDTTAITALNTYSDSTVAYNDEGTGSQTLPNRYQINGLIDTNEKVLKNAEQIASSAASWLSYDTHQGVWSVVINKAESSLASFDDENILGNISVGGTGLQDLYNSVKVAFPHRDLRDSADFVKIEIPSGDRNANEPDNTLNVTYDIINEPVQAELLGFIELKQSRVDLVIQFETDFSYINLKAGDVIDITNERYGFTNKEFRILTITERQDNSGALTLSITALEYDSDVYSVQSITRYTRSDADGIITIGSIGTPGTPQVTKYERNARPRIEIEVTSPTGVVEGLEFWITFDYTEGDDDLRSYTLIGTKRPDGGGVYVSGTTVVFEYANLNAQNFYVKARGFNATTVGQFSNPSGLVEFAPEQVPDAITPDTSILDETGGLATALGIVSLLNNLDGLFSGASGSGSLFGKVFDVFKDVTGFDLVGESQGGNLVIPTNISVKEEGSDVTTTVGSINFVGEGVTATASGSDVTITIDGSGTIPDGQNNKDILAWNAEAGEWQIIPDCISCDFPVTPPVVPDVPCSLTVALTSPSNAGTSPSGTCKSDSDVPYVGSYFIKFNINSGSTAGVSNPSISYYAPLQIGIGNVYLYASDGQLEQTLTESQLIVHNNVLELPFAPRMPGKDYYILVDEGIVTSCSCENVAIEDSSVWSFRTSIVSQPSYGIPLGDNIVATSGTPQSGPDLRITSFSPSGSGECPTQDVVITFSEAVVKNSGSVIFKDRSTGFSVKTLSVASATLSGSTLTWSSVAFDWDKDYDVEIPASLVSTNRQDTTTTICDATVTNPAAANTVNESAFFGFGTVKELAYEEILYCEAISGNSELISNIQIVFNKNIQPAYDTGCFVYIYESGQVHQKIDINADFESDGYHSVYSFDGNILTLNPTKPFKPGKSYYVVIPGATIMDDCEVEFGGVNTETFQTDGIEQVVPNAPTFGSVYVDLEFKRPVVPGFGKLNIVDSTGKLLTQLSATDPVVKFSKEPF